MEGACVIGYGIVGKATAKGLGITQYIDLTGSTISVELAAKCRFVFLCLPTPTVDGQCDTSVIRDYIKQIHDRGGRPVFVIRSTVIPGTSRKIMDELGIKTIASNPEFLTESNWEYESTHPGLVVIGADDEKTRKALKAVYEGRWRGVQIFETDNITAETIKYALNTFFVNKVVFANNIYDFCQTSGANYETIKKVLEFHPWGSKNHFTVWHKGGRGAGGKCLFKDLDSFAKENGIHKKKIVELALLQYMSSFSARAIHTHH